MKRYPSLTLTCLCCVALFVMSATVVSAKQEKVCLCHKGHTICIAAPAVPAHLNHGDTLGACAVVCGGSTGVTCSASQFCKLADGVCDANAQGVCTGIPSVCPVTVTPVCGCDGKTYNNACEANAAGVNVASAGECQVTSGACGGAAGNTCADDEFCKLADGACSEHAEGVCTVIPGVCHPDFNPVCGCDDVTYSNACFAASAGTSVAAAGACAQGTACGGTGGGTCAEGEFCRPAVGDCAAGAGGICTPTPGVCQLTVDPVCGCDGKTYTNACSAFTAGVGVNHVGECEADQQACGGTAGTCGEGKFCKRPQGECAADAGGICEPTPPICPATIAPVCGCDGITYDNACVADGAGVTVDHEGECETAQACGGTVGGTCAETQFCKRPDGMCADDVEGLCTDLPLACQPIVNEVCGCDAATYPSACFANGAGINVNHAGACTATP